MTKDEVLQKLSAIPSSIGSSIAENLEEWTEAGKTEELAAMVTRLAKYKQKAVMAETAEDVEKWTKEAEIVTLSLEHDLVQKQIVANATVAAQVKKAIMTALGVFKTVAVETLSLVAKGLMKSAISTLKEEVGGADGAPKSS